MNGKKLYRTEGPFAMLAGVCGGIGEYFNIDPTVIRVVWALLGFTGTGIVAYIACAVIIPKKGDVYPGY